MPEVELGIIPAAGGTQTLPRAVGQGRALEMLLANRWLSAEEAYHIGLVNRVVPIDEQLKAAEEVAKKIASCNPTAVRYAKQAVVRGLDQSLAEGLDLEKRLASHLYTLRAK
jgi:enoyl-CoA hydratase/carnithine racemase